MLRDDDIRAALHRHLRQLHPDRSSTRMFDEFDICASRARADVAMVNGVIAGYEIKSDADRLARLPGQVASYGRVFDQASVVCSAKHADLLLRRLPAYWGLWVVTEAASGVAFEVRREASTNGARELRAQVALLRRDELAATAAGYLDARTRGRTRADLAQLLTQRVPAADLAALVRRALVARSV